MSNITVAVQSNELGFLVYRTDGSKWFAWRPVRIGALGTGPIVWLRWLNRIQTHTSIGVSTIYQPEVQP